MPWVQIPPDSIKHLPLFGYDIIAEDDSFLWVSSPFGRMRIEKDDPRVFVDDINDAIQLGAKAIQLGAKAILIVKV